MTLNLEAIKARCEKATAGHTCTETPYGCLRCESETDSLDAECLLLVAEVERLRKDDVVKWAWVEAVQDELAAKNSELARAESELTRLRSINAAVVALFDRHGGGDIEEFYGIKALRAALDAAQGGG